MNTQSNKYFSILLLLAGTLLGGFSMGRWLFPLVIVAYILAFLIGFGADWASTWGLVFMSTLSIFYGLLWSLPYLADRLVGARLAGFAGKGWSQPIAERGVCPRRQTRATSSARIPNGYGNTGGNRRH